MNKKILIVGLATGMLLTACSTSPTEVREEEAKVEKEVIKVTEKDSNINKEAKQEEKETSSVEETKIPKMDELIALYLLEERIGNDINLSNLKLIEETSKTYNFIAVDREGNQLGDVLFVVNKDYSEISIGNGLTGQGYENYKILENEKQYGIYDWVSKDENGFTYYAKLTFISETEGFLDYEVINDKSGSVIEQFYKAPFTIDGDRATFTFSEQETKDVYAADGGDIKFRSEKIDISIYRSTVTFEKN